MFDVTPENLANEIAASQSVFKAPLDVRKTILAGYSGTAFADNAKRTPENHAHEYISLVVPRLVANNPRARVRSRIGRSSAAEGAVAQESKEDLSTKTQAVASAMEHGLNRWIRDTQHSRFLERMAVDYLTAWGVALVTLEQVMGLTDSEDIVTSPKVVPLDAGQVLWDPAALSWETRRWTAHKYAMDLNDALEKAKQEEGWDEVALRGCSIDTGLEEIQAEGSQNIPKRRQVVVWEVYIPDVQVPEGFNGMIYTLGVGGTATDAKFLREPMPFYGPVDGPYVLYGAYSVPRRSIPMSPLMATWATVEELNAHARSMSRSAARYKKIAIADGLNRKDADKINNAEDGETVLVPGFKSEAFQELTLSALDQPRLDGYLMVRNRLERGASMDETQRGVASDATATAVSIASESSATRMSWLSEKFRAADEELLRKVAYYMHQERSVVVPLSGEDMPDGQAAIFRGGSDDWDKFDFYELDIERYSMERTSEALQQRRGMELMRLVGEIAPVLPQIAPYVDIRAWLDAMGDYLNLPELGDIVSPDQAAMVFNATRQEAADAKFAGDVSPQVRRAETGRSTPVQRVPKQGNQTGNEAKKSAVHAN